MSITEKAKQIKFATAKAIANPGKPIKLTKGVYYLNKGSYLYVIRKGTRLWSGQLLGDSPSQLFTSLAEAVKNIRPV